MFALVISVIPTFWVVSVIPYEISPAVLVTPLQSQFSPVTLLMAELG